MEYKVQLTIKIKDGLKIPNCNTEGEIEKGFWSKSYIKEHFKDNFILSLTNLLEGDKFIESYVDELNFEEIQTIKDLKDNFGFEVLVDKKVVKLD